jgi:hypothetical protein
VLEESGEIALSALASLGNATLHDAGSFADVVGGLCLAALGAGGEVGGFALDLTGVGAALGVPVNVLSAVGITCGLGLASADELPKLRRRERAEYTDVQPYSAAVGRRYRICRGQSG